MTVEWYKTYCVVSNGNEYQRLNRKKERRHQHRLHLLSLFKSRFEKFKKKELLFFLRRLLRIRFSENYTKFELLEVARSLARRELRHRRYNYSYRYVKDGVVVLRHNYAIPFVPRYSVSCDTKGRVCRYKGRPRCLYYGGCGILR